MSESSVALRDATVQDIQLELVRRSRFNAMDGGRVYAGLMAHRALWVAAVFDRQGLPDFEEPRHLLAMGLIKLRDLPANLWNVDTLFLLTESQERAAELARVIEAEDWAGEVQVYDDQKEIDRALGSYGEAAGLVSVWWD